MSGVFGYEAEHFELSVGRSPSAPCCRRCALRAPGTSVLATGTSCRAQIADLGGRQAEHPLEFLAGRLQS